MLNKVYPFLIVLVVVFVGAAGIFLLSNQKTQTPDINFNPTPMPTQIPTPTSAIINSAVLTKEASKGANMDNFKTTASGLKIEDIAIGQGTEAKSGDTVTVNYLGTLLNGTKFDSSYDRNAPFTTQIGVGQVIKGWDEGIVGMKVGGKRKLIIPPDLGYGDKGAGNTIPPNSTLIFEVELLGAK